MDLSLHCGVAGLRRGGTRHGIRSAELLQRVRGAKAKYGDEFKDLKVVRFHAKKGYELAGPELRQFTPYWCRMDDEGFINCESEREQ